MHGVFYDNGFRVEANPQIARFQVREGHVELNHTYSHPHLNQLSDAAVIDEVTRNEQVLADAGAPLTYMGFRPPFFEANARVRALIQGLGYTLSLGAVQTDDWDPARTADEIRDAIVGQLAPGAVILLHDGPVDTPAGAATVQALGQIIDIARSRGYCFGVTDHTGEVVASRYVRPAGRSPRSSIRCRTTCWCGRARRRSRSCSSTGRSRSPPTTARTGSRADRPAR